MDPFARTTPPLSTPVLNRPVMVAAEAGTSVTANATTIPKIAFFVFIFPFLRLDLLTPYNGVLCRCFYGPATCDHRYLHIYSPILGKKQVDDSNELAMTY